MVRRILVAAVILLFAALGHTQNTWIKTYGGYHKDEGFDVQQTADGGYIIVGSTRSYGPGYSAVYLIKTNANGDTLWTRTYGGNKTDIGLRVQQTNDHGYMIVGYTHSFNDGYASVYLIKTDENGDTLWTHVYCVGIGWSGQQTLDGGYVILGRNSQSGILIKTDAKGDTLWTRTYNVYIIGCGYDVQQTVDGGYIMSGEMGGLAALVKTDPEGRIQWYRHFGAKRLDRGYSVRQTADGGYIMTGIQYIPGPMESSSRIFLVKTDAAGDTHWTRKLGDDSSAGKCVRQTLDGGYIITGYADMDFISLIKTDQMGYPVWAKHLERGIGEAVRQTSDGGYVITGACVTEDNGIQILLIKTDDSGNFTGIRDKNKQQPALLKNLQLYQNNPNPFNQSTTINYEIFGNTQDIKINIYNLAGKEVMTLVKEKQSQGKYQITWDGRDERSTEVPSGMYIYKLQKGGGGIAITKTMLLIR